MKHVEFQTSGVCARKIIFDITDENKITNLQFIGGCPGNLRAISKLCEGQDAKQIATILKGNICKTDTSCADQLSKAILENL